MSKGLSNILLNWYSQYRRDLPFRNTQDPYKVWISEIVFQQTRIEQGLPYYEAFLKAFPSIQDLARASQDQVLSLWQGLGYYSRARNLHETAKYIAFHLKGQFPTTYEDILNLKGIGPYTAAAIASFCYHQPVLVIDGNVIRWTSRYFGLAGPIEAASFKKQIQEKLAPCLDGKTVALFNQAIMEFGALQCTISKPDCIHCPLKRNCYAFGHGVVDQYPAKKKKIKRTQRYLDYVWLIYKDQVFLKKRTQKDIWQGLYEPYLLENKEAVPQEKILETQVLPLLKSLGTFKLEEPSTVYKHVLSHQDLCLRFWWARLKTKPNFQKESWVNRSEMDQYSMSIIVRRVWDYY